MALTHVLCGTSHIVSDSGGSELFSASGLKVIHEGSIVRSGAGVKSVGHLCQSVSILSLIDTLVDGEIDEKVAIGRVALRTVIIVDGDEKCSEGIGDKKQVQNTIVFHIAKFDSHIVYTMKTAFSVSTGHGKRK